MKLLDMICKELGINTGEKWLGNDGRRYKIDGNGRLLKAGRKIWAEESYCGYRNLLTGNLKPVWKPKEGEEIYLVTLEYKELWDIIEWSDSEISYQWLERGLVYKTEEEAMKAANKMLAALKED